MQRIDSPKGVKSSLFRVLEFGPSSRTGGELQLDDSSLQPDHGRMGSVAGAQFGKDVLDSPLDGLLGDRELVRDLLCPSAASCIKSVSRHTSEPTRSAASDAERGTFIAGWKNF